MKRVGISYGKIVCGFAFLPSINLCWMPQSDGTYHDLQFAWLWWYCNIGTAIKKCQEWK